MPAASPVGIHPSADGVRNGRAPILLLAPHPFFQERGTPIATNLLLAELARRGERVDVVTCHEGRDVRHAGVALHRIPAPPGVRNIPPGFSVKKLVCDVLVAIVAIRLCRRRRYRIAHCVEEAAFIGLLLRWWFKLPYIYDADSSLSHQLIGRHAWLRLLRPALEACERLIVRHADVVVPVCEALAQRLRRFDPKRLVLLRDISLLSPADPAGGKPHPLQLGGPVVLYAGNLERYQGIDLLLESFVRVAAAVPSAHLVLVGGTQAHIERYRQRAQALGIGERTHFVGPQPVEALGDYLREAAVLVSPRMQGHNTPMKIYSYLDSGTPIVATDLETHTQVLTPQVSVLTAPVPEALADGIMQLLLDETRRRLLGQAGQALVRAHHSLKAFQDAVERVYGGPEPWGRNGREASGFPVNTAEPQRTRKAQR